MYEPRSASADEASIAGLDAGEYIFSWGFTVEFTFYAGGYHLEQAGQESREQGSAGVMGIGPLG